MCKLGNQRYVARWRLWLRFAPYYRLYASSISRNNLFIGTESCWCTSAQKRRTTASACRNAGKHRSNCCTCEKPPDGLKIYMVSESAVRIPSRNFFNEGKCSDRTSEFERMSALSRKYSSFKIDIESRRSTTWQQV